MREGTRTGRGFIGLIVMKVVKNHLKPIIMVTIGLSLLITGVARGAELSVLASVDRTRISVGDVFTLTVTVTGEGISRSPEPVLPDLPAFDVVGRSSSTSTSFNIVNGKFSRTATVDYRFQLRPREVGTFTIGSVVVEFRGTKYRSDPMQIEVVEGKTQPAPPTGTKQPPTPSAPLDRDLVGSDLFLVGESDRTKAYVGQQVTVTYAFYTRVALGTVSFGAVPSYSGFWVEDIHTADRLEFEPTVIEGKRYNGMVIKKVALFPTRAGQLTIDPMELICQIRLRTRDIFDFWGRTETVRVASKPITIEVDPLPQKGRPASFDGAVGTFTVSAQVDTAEACEGDAINLVVDVKGKGNLRTLPNPAIPDIEGFKRYDPEVSQDLTRTGGVIGGSKTYRYVLIPQQEGEYEIGSIDLAYFNPQEGSYEVSRTEPISLVIHPGERGIGIVSFGGGRHEVKVLGRDIRYIKPTMVRLESQEMGLYHQPGFILLQVFPLIVVGLAVLYRRHLDRLSRDVVYARHRRAYGTARRRLADARQHLKERDAATFYALASKALIDYIGDRLNIDPLEVTIGSMDELLSERGVPEEAIEQIVDCLSACNYARFAPFSTPLAGMITRLHQAQGIIRRLEQIDLGKRTRRL